jgi:exonuclease III
MAGITTYQSILALNVNGLNSPLKTQQLENWIKKEDPKFVVYKKFTLQTERNIALG